MSLIIKIPGEYLILKIPPKHIDQAEDYMRAIAQAHCEKKHLVDMDSIKIMTDAAIGMVRHYRPEDDAQYDSLWTDNFRIADTAKSVIAASSDPNTRLSDHFTLGELTYSEMALRRHIDNTAPVRFLSNLTGLCLRVLEPIRDHYEQPFSPISGWRTAILNEAVGGSKDSQHCKAQAVDLEVPGVSNYDLAIWIRQNLEFDHLILEHYTEGQPTSGWVHVSLRTDHSPGSINQHQTLTHRKGIYIEGLHE